jgi:hypothetical protein
MLANSLSTAGEIKVLMGDLDEALRYCDEAYELCRAIQNHWGMAYSQLTTPLAHWDRGDWDLALAASERAVEHGRLGGFAVPELLSPVFHTILYTDLGAHERAKNSLSTAYQVEDERVQLFYPLLVGAELHVHVEQNDLARAQEVIVMHPDVFNGRLQTFVGYDTLMAVYMRLLLARAEMATVLDESQTILLEFRRTRVRRHIPDLLLYRALAQRAHGDMSGARETMLEARTEARQLTSRRILWQIQFALYQLEMECGEPAEARKNLDEAQSILRYISGRLQPHLAATFLDTAHARAVLQAQ